MASLRGRRRDYERPDAPDIPKGRRGNAEQFRKVSMCAVRTAIFEREAEGVKQDCAVRQL